MTAQPQQNFGTLTLFPPIRKPRRMTYERNLHGHISAMDAAFSAAGFSVEMDNDAGEYQRTIAGIKDYSITSPLDHRLVNMTDDFLWLRVFDKRGNLVAIEAGRVIYAPKKKGGLNAVIERKVFGRVLPVMSRLPATNLCGRLGYLGGAYVIEKLRGVGIMSLAVKMTAAHLDRCFGIDQGFGFVRQPQKGQALAPEKYGFTSGTVIDGIYLHGSAAAESLCMVWTDPGVLKERWSREPEYSLEVKGRPQRQVQSPRKSRR
jgi:hypothetical protein